MVHHIYNQIIVFYRITLGHFEGDKNQLIELYNKTTLVAQGGIPGLEKCLLNQFKSGIYDFADMRSKIAFKY